MPTRAEATRVEAKTRAADRDKGHQRPVQSSRGALYSFDLTSTGDTSCGGPQWSGAIPAQNAQANENTFHYTNAAPQAAKSNQGLELWLGLESYLRDNAADNRRRLLVFTDLVFTYDDPCTGVWGSRYGSSKSPFSSTTPRWQQPGIMPIAEKRPTTAWPPPGGASTHLRTSPWTFKGVLRFPYQRAGSAVKESGFPARAFRIVVSGARNCNLSVQRTVSTATGAPVSPSP